MEGEGEILGSLNWIRLPHNFSKIFKKFFHKISPFCAYEKLHYNTNFSLYFFNYCAYNWRLNIHITSQELHSMADPLILENAIVTELASGVVHAGNVSFFDSQTEADFYFTSDMLKVETETQHIYLPVLAVSIAVAK